MVMLNNKQLRKLDKDPTKPIEAKVQTAVKKIKDHLSASEYRTLYPSGSAPGKFYGTAKKHKIPSKCPLRPTVLSLTLE